MNRSRPLAWIAAGAIATITLPTQAGLIGETLRYQRLAPTIHTPVQDPNNGDHEVGHGIEIADAFQGTITIDVQNEALVLTFRDLGIANRPFVGFSLSDARDEIDDFTAFDVSPESTRTFDAWRLSFDADHLWVNLAGMTFVRGDRLVFAIAQSPSAPVAEPTSLAMNLLGLAGVLAVARRSRRSFNARWTGSAQHPGRPGSA